MKYYLYRHIRKDNLKPFYIGIGTKPKRFNTYEEEYRRAFKKCDRQLHWKRIVEKVGYEVEMMFESDNYNLIKEKERSFIKLYGREDLATGFLINKTDGGDGTTGTIRKPMSEKNRLKLIQRNKARKLTEDHKRKLNEGRRNHITTLEQRENYRRCKLGVKQSESHRLNNSLAKSMGNHPFAKKINHIPTGAVYSCIKEAAVKHNLNYLSFIRHINKITKNGKYAKTFQEFSII